MVERVEGWTQGCLDHAQQKGPGHLGIATIGCFSHAYNLRLCQQTLPYVDSNFPGENLRTPLEVEPECSERKIVRFVVVIRSH